MLHQISWFTFGASIISVILIYYVYVGIAFYQAELKSAFYRLTGKQPACKTNAAGDLQLPDYAIMGKAQTNDVAYISQEELSFGPVDFPDSAMEEDQQLDPLEKDSKLTRDFSDMVSELKTLIRVVDESGESKENFEMLLTLIIQKYPALAGTGYSDKIKKFLLEAGVPHFSFPLSASDLDNYWLNENKSTQ